jgi:hypothetical protein
MTPIEYEPPSGSALSRKATKNSNSTPIRTGGTPVSRMKGVARARIQRGERGQPAIAPKNVPITKLRIVVTTRRPSVQGIDCAIRSMTVVGYFCSE